jgi:hypothetical protein
MKVVGIRYWWDFGRNGIAAQATARRGHFHVSLTTCDSLPPFLISKTRG